MLSVQVFGVSVWVTIGYEDPEDTEGYNPAEVTYQLEAKHRPLLARLAEYEIPESFRRRRNPLFIEMTWAPGDVTRVRFDAAGIRKLQELDRLKK